jgi:hypothetical protein
VQHVVFHVAGGGDWDELDAAIDEARELGLPIGFYSVKMRILASRSRSRTNRQGVGSAPQSLPSQR